MSEGKKFDTGKAPIVSGCLHYFPKALLAVAAVSDYGAKKYDVSFEDKNWSRLHNAEKRYGDGLGRHVALEGLELWDTGNFDPTGAKGSDLLHAAHAAWNALAKLELLLDRGVSLQRPDDSDDIDDSGIPF
ncbi:MAG: DUF5664 domain-containing protein [Coriobacteriia bacterium]|nr:DUF5664 domain-containing protein [Coriobacteriia bacterium]